MLFIVDFKKYDTEAKAFIVRYDYPKYVELFGEIEEG